MFDLHIFSRFLRLLRSIRRSLLAFFVAIAMLLATFVIAPAYALSAGEGTGASADVKTNTAQTEGAKADGAGGAKASGVKSDGAKADGAQKQGVQQSEPNKTESDKKNTDTSSNLKNNNKELKPDSKRQPDSNKADNKADNNADNNAKSDDKTKSSDKTGKTVEKSAANKNGKDAKNKAAGSAKAANGTDRSTKEEHKLPEECGNKPFKSCYVVSYYNNESVVDNNHPVLIQPGNTITIKPKFKIKSTNKQAPMPSGVWFKLEQYLKYPVPSWANFEKDNGATKVKDTSKDKTGFDGSVTLRPNSKWDYGSYKFKVFAYYKKKSEKIYATISVKVDVSDAQKDDLKLSLYDFVNKKDKAPVSDNKITIKPKTNSQGSSGGTTGSTDNTDVYDPINKLFIDSKSTKKPGFIHHHMICHENGSDNYTLDSVNGLNLSNKDGSTTDKQTWFKHVENNKPTSGADKYSVYLNDDTERSQSWISGTPTKAGTFECKVFAIKDVDISYSENLGKTFLTEYFAKYVTDRLKYKTREVFSDPDTKIYAARIPNTSTSGLDESVYKPQKTIDWDYKSVTIEVKSSNPPKPEPPKIGDNDLTLKVYPFKNSDGSLPTALSSSNNKISAMLGMELKPFIDATSAADSKNKITLRVLCSKGEKKKGNAAGGGSGASAVGTGSNDGNSSTGSSDANTSAGSIRSTQSGSKSEQPSGSSQAAENLEYKTWSSNLAELGLSVPADTAQTRCNGAGDGKCTADKIASQASMEMSIKPTEVGDYQCVVFALKPDALTKFDDAISKATQSGSLTPTSISSALTSAKPTAFKENKDFATFAFNLHLVSNFTLPNTGGQSWNLQLGILAALLVNLLAAGFVVSQSERARKLILGRWRGLCNYV